jgi:hypothetical protein
VQSEDLGGRSVKNTYVEEGGQRAGKGERDHRKIFSKEAGRD